MLNVMQENQSNCRALASRCATHMAPVMTIVAVYLEKSKSKQELTPLLNEVKSV